MPNGFKFMSTKHVAGFLNGSVRFSTLDYFRGIEGPEWIRDCLEGITKVEIPSVKFDSRAPDAAEKRMKLFQLGVMIGSGVVEMTNSQSYLIAHHLHVFCFSKEPFETARKAMCDDAPEGWRYDACVEIRDIRAFCEAMEDGKINGQPFREAIASTLGCRDVRYNKATLAFDMDEEFYVDPFQKPAHFACQQEIRFVIQPRAILPPNMYVEFDVPDGLLKQLEI
ncbi:hypothetical protein [Rhizobium herbae]|uniref:Uncharacterized protein n=1 Tax=Rhizobium herbae TaxID=508661 RepID=A0ABS4EP44_9HYPH|nr:hypothetical protein [Rhizobium herbae]MBP1859695.1 hypothetical protein [Rhizobium herbae]